MSGEKEVTIKLEMMSPVGNLTILESTLLTEAEIKIIENIKMEENETFLTKLKKAVNILEDIKAKKTKVVEQRRFITGLNHNRIDSNGEVILSDMSSDELSK
jgi:hypothetical protein